MQRIYLLLFALLPLFAFAQEEDSTASSAPVVTALPADAPSTALRIGHVSYEAVLQEMPEYAIARQKLEDLKTTYNAELERAEQEFSKKFSEFIDGKQSFPENILLKRQKELQLLMDQSVSFKTEARRLLTEAEADLMRPLHARLKGAIAAVATELSLDYVLNTDNDACPFINPGGNGRDITEAVLKHLGAK